jgi:hypothetical protein
MVEFVEVAGASEASIVPKVDVVAGIALSDRSPILVTNANV